jgi:hypothetical protein
VLCGGIRYQTCSQTFTNGSFLCDLKMPTFKSSLVNLKSKGEGMSETTHETRVATKTLVVNCLTQCTPFTGFVCDLPARKGTLTD